MYHIFQFGYKKSLVALSLGPPGASQMNIELNKSSEKLVTKINDAMAKTNGYLVPLHAF